IFGTIVAAFYLIVDKDGTERLLKAILPAQYERPTLLVFSRFKDKIKNWFTAQLALSLIVGLVVCFGLWILNVRYFVVIAVLAAVFELVPIIGPVITGIVAFLAAVSDSVTLGIYAVIFFFIVQQLENHVLTPLVMGRALRVHPVIVVVSLLAGAQIAGFTGIILAVPVAVLAQEIFEYFSDRKKDREAMI
ncbi:MAG: AI-2E family transporter, partial [Patescibacteria group bacterium]